MRKTTVFKTIMVCVFLAAAAVAVPLASQASFGPMWEPLGVVVDWDPTEESERFALQLLNARTAPEVEALLHQVLELMGVGVYSPYGEVVVVGNEQGPGDFYLYDFEVRLMARAFVEEQYMTLEAASQPWQAVGLMVRSADPPFRAEPISSVAVEDALRYARRQAEEYPEQPQGFVIRLIDELGNRERHGFDLLADPDEEESEPQFGGVRKMLEDEFSSIRDEALASGDQEEAAWAESMMEGGELDALADAMMSGDIGAMLRFAMEAADVDAEELREVEAEMREIPLDALPEEYVSAHALGDFLDAMARVSADEDTDFDDLFEFLEVNLRVLQTQRDASAARIERMIDGIVDALNEEKERLRDGRGSARSALSASHNYAAGLGEAAGLQLDLDEFSAFVDETEAVYEEQRREHELLPQKTAAFPLQEEPDEVSNLLLDPIQVFLVHLDLLVDPKGVAADHGDSSFDLWGLLAPTTAQASVLDPCHHIGQLQSQHPNLYGGLQTLLDVAGATKGAVSEFSQLNMGKALSRIARGAFNTMTTAIQVRVVYQPRDVGETYKRYWEDDPKHIDIYVEVKDLLPEVIPEPIRNALHGVASATEVCGPLRDLANLAGGDAGRLADSLDAVRRLADGRDLSNIPVHFQLDREYWDAVQFKVSDWEAIRPPDYTQFLQRTDDAGRASGRFYPAVESPDLGGMRRELLVPVRVQARIHESPSVMWSPAAWGLAVGEEAFGPIERWVDLKVIELVPGTMTGTVFIERKVEARGRAVHETSAGGSSTTQESGTITATVRLNNVQLRDGGGFDSNGRIQVSGNWQEDFTLETPCDDGGTAVKTENVRGQINAQGRGRVVGIQLQVDSASDTQDISWGTILQMAGAHAAGQFGQERIKATTRDCEGDTDTDEFTRQASLPEHMYRYLFGTAVSRRVPGNSRPEFVREDIGIKGDVTWTETYPSRAMQVLSEHRGDPPASVTYTVTTTVTWDFTRSF